MIAEQEEAVRIARETRQKGRKKTPTPSNTPSTSNAGSQPNSGKNSQDDQHPTTSGIRRSTRKRSASGKFHFFSSSRSSYLPSNIDRSVSRFDFPDLVHIANK